MNKETEVTNRTIFQDLKTQLDKAKGLWVDGLYSILWTYQTMYWLPIGDTLFNLIFRLEAAILLELGLLSYRVQAYDKHRNLESLRVNLDLLEKVWEKAQIQMIMHQR